MEHKNYLLVSAVVFAGVAVAHLARLTGGWSIVIDGWPVPGWLSVAGVLLPGALSAWGFAAARRA